MPTFLNGGVLGALALVGLPIAIHLLNRRRFKIVRWGAMEFLLAANRKNRKRVRLEHFIVLLLRCLAMALIVFLVARPVATSGALNYLPGARDAVERVIVLDDSGSMGYSSNRSTSFSRAQALIKRMALDMRAARSGDLLSVYRSSQLAPDLPPSPPNERVTEFLGQLEAWEPSEFGFDPVATLKRVLGRVLAGEDAPQRKVIYLLTDLKQRDWVGDQGLLPKSLARVMRAAPSEDVAFLIVDTSVSERRNLGVSAFHPGEKLAMEGVPLQLVAKVKNHGTQTAVDVQLVLDTGESRVPWPPIPSIAPGEEVEVRHRYTFTSAGVRQLVLRLAEDPLPLDDSRALALDVRERLKVLLVDGDPRPGPLAAETDMLRIALAPADDSATGVSPEVVELNELPTAELRSYQAVFLCNVEAFDPAPFRDYVERGGGLAIFLGDAVDQELYRRELYRGGAGLLPSDLGERLETESIDDAPGLEAPTDEHPLEKTFGGEHNPFLRHVRGRVRMSCPLDEARDETTKVWLRYADPQRTPFVLEKPLGKGRVVLLNTTADLAWSTWPRDPSFLVSAHELVQTLAPDSTLGRNRDLGEPLAVPLNPALYHAEAELIVPGAKKPAKLYAEPREDSDALWLNVPTPSRAGLYRLRLTRRQGAQVDEELYALNLDPDEGDTEPADRARMTPAFEDLRVQIVGAGANSDLLSLSDGTKSELWRSCLYALLIVFLLEQVLAWRAAHHPTEDGPQGGIA